MQALEIRNLGGVTGFNKGFESLLDQRCQTATEHGLFTEKVALSFLFERCLQYAGPGRSDAMRVSQPEFVGAAAGVLLDGKQGGHATSFAVNATHQVSGAFGSDHHDVNVAGRHNGFEMNAEAMREAEHFAGMQVWLDVLVI